MDLISRQAALIAIRNLYPDMPRVDFMDNISNWQKRNKQYIECENAIEKLPSAQKIGTWEIRTDPYGFFEEIPVCSVCGCTNKWREKYSYCPMCGARMECEQDG